MKFKRHLILLFTALMLNSCSPKVTHVSAEVNYVSSIDGTVTLRVIGEGTNQKALENAERKVFDVILFRGVPESQEKLAMVGSNESEEKVRNSTYFDRLFAELRYKSFILSVVPISSAYKESGIKKSAFDIKVNTAALRRDLEQHNIIRKFGY